MRDLVRGRKYLALFLVENEDEVSGARFLILGYCVTRSLEIIEAETHLVRQHKNVEGEEKLKLNAGCRGGSEKWGIYLTKNDSHIS